MAKPTATSEYIKRITVPEIKACKGAEKIISLTAYTKWMAKLIDPHVDIIIVGDSTGMVAYGLRDTLAMTLDMMIAHGSAVMRGSQRACVVIDMPFGTYQESHEQAFRNCARVLIETGAHALKLEGGQEMAGTVKFLVDRGIPVMAHIGLMPQHVKIMGGFKVQGSNEREVEKIIADAESLAQAGAFSILIEGIREPIARRVTELVAIPTIGIGASPACDGQVLVTEDILGLSSEYMPRFAKRYVNITEQISRAAEQFALEVKNGAFPQSEHCFTAKI